VGEKTVNKKFVGKHLWKYELSQKNFVQNFNNG